MAATRSSDNTHYRLSALFISNFIYLNSAEGLLRYTMAEEPQAIKIPICGEVFITDKNHRNLLYVHLISKHQPASLAKY